jgi:RNA polymerase sigma factor (sigma-70 family)
MSDDRLEQLLERLNCGDRAAAEELFLSYEPYLRMVVRRQLSPRLRTKFDSVDVIQSVWLSLFDRSHQASWHFSDAAHLRAFLIQAARNRMIDLVRHHRGSLDHERPMLSARPDVEPTSNGPTPSEIAQADDLWERLSDMCSPLHREVLTHKRQGLPLAEVAAQTGLHEGSVRRILYDLARQLATSQ